jgi:dTDP-4-dehydrorhamnose reductase
MKVLVTGGGGQLASRLMALRPKGIDTVSLSHNELDIADQQSVITALDRLQPTIAINTAAYTNVDRAEAEQKAAHATNAAGSRHLALAAAQRGIRLIHVSTDFVFDGAESSPYKPEHPVNPLGEYGRSKALGEAQVREALGDAALIIRTAWLYSAQGRNFLRTMLRLMRERGEVAVVADQIGTPTSVDSLATALWRAVATPEFRGTHHFTDAGVASWYDFAVAIAEEAGALGLVQGPVVVRPIRTEQYPTAARRPAYSVLDSSSTEAALGLKRRHWRAPLRDELRKIENA